jgi:hypothetical protein
MHVFALLALRKASIVAALAVRAGGRECVPL